MKDPRAQIFADQHGRLVAVHILLDSDEPGLPIILDDAPASAMELARAAVASIAADPAWLDSAFAEHIASSIESAADLLALPGIPERVRGHATATLRRAAMALRVRAAEFQH